MSDAHVSFIFKAINIRNANKYTLFKKSHKVNNKVNVNKVSIQSFNQRFKVSRCLLSRSLFFIDESIFAIISFAFINI